MGRTVNQRGVMKEGDVIIVDDVVIIVELIKDGYGYFRVARNMAVVGAYRMKIEELEAEIAEKLREIEGV